MLLPTVITPPAAMPITLAEAKAHLRLDSADEDAVVTSLIKTATSYIEAQYGLALVTQTLSWATDCFGGVRGIKLTRRPVQSVTSVEYYEPAATTLTTLDGAGYIHVESRIKLASGASWPSVYARDNAILVTYVAGFGAAADVPDQIKWAIRLLIGDMYANREAKVDARFADNQTLNMLLGQFWRTVV